MRAGVDVDFVEADVEHAPAVLGHGRLILVYTGIGRFAGSRISARWARVVASLLRPAGRLFMREGHPMLWTLSDPRQDGLLVVDTPTSRSPAAQCSTSQEANVGHEGELEQPTTVGFNHGLGELSPRCSLKEWS